MQPSDGPAGEVTPGLRPVPTWVRLVVVLFSAWAMSASTFPLGWWFMHPLALVPPLVVLPGARRPWLWLLLYATVAESLIFVWIQQTIELFSNIPGSVAWGILGLFGVVFGLPLAVLMGLAGPLRRRLGAAWWLAWPAACVIVEWVSQYVILFPFPQGISHHRLPWLWQLASVTGTWGLTFLICLLSAALAEPLLRWREGRPPAWGPLGVAVGTYAAVAAFGAWRFHDVVGQEERAEVLRVGQVQTQHGMRWRQQHRAHEAFGLWLDLTRQIDDEPMDLLVWPEGAVPFDLNASFVAPALWDLTEEGGFDLVAGSGTRQREPDPERGEDQVRVFNSVYIFDRARRVAPDRSVDGPEALLTRLEEAGCDLGALHLFTPWEVAALREAAAEGSACSGALDEAWAGWEAQEPRVREVARLASGRLPWALLRAHSARFTEPLVTQRIHVDRRDLYHRVDEAGCGHGDCRHLILRCSRRDAEPCDLFPEAPHYDKMVPLPFGEYLPLREVFPWLADLIRGPGNFRAGTKPLVFDVGGVRFGAPICYEGILSYVCTQFEGADLLINVTNDAWFGEGAASDLHGMLVLARAMELGIPVVRSTYTGTSFIALPSGRVTHKTGLFEDVARVVEVPRVRVDTVYARWGDWFVLVCGALLLVMGARHRSTGAARA